MDDGEFTWRGLGIVSWLKEVELTLPSDEEINDWVASHGYYGHCTSEWHEGLNEGVKHLRELITKQLKIKYGR